MGINSDWDKWTKTGKAPWEWSENQRMREINRMRDNIRMRDYYKALNAGMKEDLFKTSKGSAKGLARTAAPRALGFMANPWLAAIAGMFGPTQMGNSEFIGSPEHQQWLARRGPLAKR